MTNEHVITKDIIKNKKKIKFYYDNESKSKEIYLNNEERFIKEFTDNELDITVIEIISKDKIDEGFFLLPCIDYMFNYKGLINKEITVIQYPGGKLSYSNGIIKEIKNNEITHLASTELGSSGSPIFLKDTIKVIGIHKSGNKDNSENYANLIGPIFNFFSNFRKEKDKIVYENGECYIGEWKNGLKHGKGIYYYKRGEIGYEDIWNDDKLSGKGTYLFKKGDKYIRQFEDDSSNKKEINHNLVKKIKDSDSLSENLLRCEVCVNEHQEDKTNQIIINFIDTRMNESKILIDSNKTIDELIRFYFEINGRSDLYGDPSIIFLSCGKVISYDFKKKKTIKELMNELGEFDRIYIIVCDIDDKMEKKK